MKTEILVKVDFDDIQGMIDEIKRLQTYKLFEGDDMVLVDIDAVVAIMVNHIRATDNSSESPSGWIPCSERLPDEDHWLGGSGKQFSSNVFVSIVNRSDKYSWVDISHTIDGEWALELPRHCKVIAWMPLPEPYQPKEE